MQTLELKLLGTPRIFLGGKPVEPDTRKATALLAYLAVTGQPQTRDALALLLYPDYDDAHARGALRRTLHALKEILGADHLYATRERIELVEDPAIQVDVRRFNALISSSESHPHRSIDECPQCLAALEEAVQTCQGDFLAGFSLRDSQNFDDWQFFTREELRRKLGSALSVLAGSYCKRGECEKGIQAARAWLAMDPLVEEAHRKLMSCYAMSGQRNAALRQYQECVRILEKELGVPPLEETTRLYQSILDDRLDSIKIESSAASQAEESLLKAISQPFPNLHHYPLVGRSRESAYIVQSYMRNAAHGYFLALEGETGIGKTRLAEEFLASIQSQGAAVIKSRCYEGESSLAFGPLVDALNGALADRAGSQSITAIPAKYLSEAARLAPALFDLQPSLLAPPLLSSPGAQSLFYEGLRQTLLGMLKGAQPGVIFFDDLQWADSATLDFLAYLARRLPGNRLFLMAAWRSEDFAGLQTLRSLLSEAGRSGYGRSLELKRLQPKDIEDLLRVIDPALDQVPDQFSDRLYLETEGLPYFLVEYLDSYLQNAAGASETPDHEHAWEIPQSVRDLLRLRLQKIDELSRQLLAAAAVVGRSFDFDTLLSASGRSELEAIAGLETLLANGLIEECSSCDAVGEIFYDFTHDKLRRLVYDETSQTRRRLLHRRVGDALVTRQRSQTSQGQLESTIALHYAQSGQELLAAEHFKLAGDHARSLYANREALRHYQAALQSGYPAEAELLEWTGDLRTLLGEYEAAVQAYQQALLNAEDAALAVLKHKIGRVQMRSGDWEQAIRSLENAFENSAPEQPDLRARILVDWSMAEYQCERTERAQELALQALAYSGQTGQDIAASQARNILGILARSRKDYPLALKELETSLALADERGDDLARTAALNNLALVLADLGELEMAILKARQALEISHRLGDLHRQAALHSNLADLLHEIGREEEALQHLTESVKIFSQVGGQSSELKPDIWKLTEW